MHNGQFDQLPAQDGIVTLPINRVESVDVMLRFNLASTYRRIVILLRI